MSAKNSKTSKTNKTNKAVRKGAGRPKATVSWPKAKFTFEDLVAANTHVKPLTLRNHLNTDMYRYDAEGNRLSANPKSLIVCVGKMKAEGKGRRKLIYQLRSRRDAAETAKKASKVSVPVTAPAAAPATAPTAPVDAPASTEPVTA